MNFQVPQFIEEKPKIIGPLTLQQFAYLAIAGIISFLSYLIFNFFLWFFITAIIGILAIVFAFVKVNGVPFPLVLQSSLTYYWKPRVYTWQRPIAETALDISSVEKLEAARRSMSIQEKLKSIALNITTGKLLSPQEFREQTPKERYQPVTFLTGERRLAKRVDYK